MRCGIAKFPVRNPTDVTGLDRVLQERGIPHEAVFALVSKTDGNGELNDHSRLLAEMACEAYFAEHLKVGLEEVRTRIQFLTSSGNEGLTLPHGYVLYETKEPESGREASGWGLAAGRATTRILAAEEIGTTTQVELVAAAVKNACAAAQLSAEDVGIVFVKAPVLQPSRNDDAVTISPRDSIRRTRAAGALGVAVALGEVAREDISPNVIGTRSDLYSKVAFTFSGNELGACRILVLGNSPAGDPDYFIRSIPLRHPADLAAVQELLGQSAVGGDTATGDMEGDPSLVGVFAKVGVDSGVTIGGKKLTIAFSDLDPGRQLRAVLSGLFVSLLQDPEVFISAGAEHQGPPGGGLVAAVRQNLSKSEAVYDE